jgi:hypothetical protein
LLPHFEDDDDDEDDGGKSAVIGAVLAGDPLPLLSWPRTTSVHFLARPGF